MQSTLSANAGPCMCHSTRPPQPVATIVQATSRPWRLIELSLVNLPHAARTGQEGERHRPADRQQLGWLDNRHAWGPAWRAIVARAAAAETRGGEAAIRPALDVDRPPCAVAARAVHVQLKAMPADVANGLERKFAEHACDVERGNSRIMPALTAQCGMRARSSASSDSQNGFGDAAGTLRIALIWAAVVE